MNRGSKKNRFTRTFKNQCRKNSRTVTRLGRGELDLISAAIDYSHAVLDCCLAKTSVFHVVKVNPVNKILLAAILKNFVSFCTILDLMERGLHGSARMILRNVYEGLIISKFCALCADRKVFGQWDNGMNVQLTNDVLNKIKSPDTDAFIRLWKLLCKSVHASIYSQQASLEAETNLDGIQLVFHITRALLECNHHLLTQYFVSFSIESFSDDGEGQQVLAFNAELQHQFSSSRKHLFPPFRKFIAAYKQKWILR
jgi:hypothetical protein